MTGRPDMYAQIISASGAIFRTDFETPNTGLVFQEVKDVASGKRGAFFATADAQDTRLAVWVVPIQGGGAIEVVQDLAPTGIDAALAQTRLLLIAFAAGAILLAAGLGTLIGRAALAPVKRLTATVEEVTKTRDLSRRVAAQGRDELSRLGTSFDAMLGQLETSLRSQRQLVDDASFRYPKVHFNVTSAPSSIKGVKVRVARAITNLLDNAAKYSPPGATVDVAVANGEISVRDHGPGVAAEDATRVFDRFWRSNDARHLPGSGLGLSIVKDVAESHGGSVTLERPIDGGGGARFRLRLKGA